MKRKIFNIGLVLGALTVMSSCEKTDGPLYSGDANKLSFFSKTTSLNMAGGSVSVPVGRTSTSGSLSVPLTLTATGTGYTNVFKLSGPVEFADGEGKAYATINYGDISTIDPSTLSVTAKGLDVNVGLAFPISLNIADDNVSVSNAKKIDVLASSVLEFEDKGTVELNSTEGWAEEVLNVKIQKAKTANVYKLVSPFDENSIAFMIKSDGKTVVFPNQVLGTSATYGAITMSNVTGSVTDGVVTLNVAGYTVSAGSFGSGVEKITLPK